MILLLKVILADNQALQAPLVVLVQVIAQVFTMHGRSQLFLVYGSAMLEFARVAQSHLACPNLILLAANLQYEHVGVDIQVCTHWQVAILCFCLPHIVSDLLGKLHVWLYIEASLAEGGAEADAIAVCLPSVAHVALMLVEVVVAEFDHIYNFFLAD